MTEKKNTNKKNKKKNCFVELRKPRVLLDLRSMVVFWPSRVDLLEETPFYDVGRRRAELRPTCPRSLNMDGHERQGPFEIALSGGNLHLSSSGEGLEPPPPFTNLLYLQTLAVAVWGGVPRSAHVDLAPRHHRHLKGSRGNAPVGGGLGVGWVSLSLF